jgi:hypothetical protein
MITIILILVPIAYHTFVCWKSEEKVVWRIEDLLTTVTAFCRLLRDIFNLFTGPGRIPYSFCLSLLERFSYLGLEPLYLGPNTESPTKMARANWNALRLLENNIVGCINRIKRLSIGINNWILTKDLSINKWGYSHRLNN